MIGRKSRSSRFHEEEDDDYRRQRPTLPPRRQFSDQLVSSFMSDDVTVVQKGKSSPWNKKFRLELVPSFYSNKPSQLEQQEQQQEHEQKQKAQLELAPSTLNSKLQQQHQHQRNGEQGEFLQQKGKLAKRRLQNKGRAVMRGSPTNSFAEEIDVEVPTGTYGPRKASFGIDGVSGRIGLFTGKPGLVSVSSSTAPGAFRVEGHSAAGVNDIHSDVDESHHANNGEAGANQMPLITAFAIEDDSSFNDEGSDAKEVFEAEALDLKGFIKRKWCWLLIPSIVLVCGGAIGFGVIVRGSEPPQMITLTPTMTPTEARVTESPSNVPTIQPRCTLCSNGRESTISASDLSQNFVQVSGTNVSCMDLMESQGRILVSDLDCTRGQALAWRHCGCPSAPSPTNSDIQCDLCPRGAPPLNQSDYCVNEDSFVSIMGTWMPDRCEALVELGRRSCECPTETELRVQDFRSILSPVVSNTGALFNETSTPYQALQWIALEDPLALNVSAVAEGVIIERFVMALLYFANGGANWTTDLGFLSNSSICEWNTLTFRSPIGVGCVDGDRATYVSLPSFNLVGSLPQEIGLLTSLQSLDFTDNQLVGTIPSTLANIDTLQSINAPDNHFTGSLPEQLFTIPGLVVLAMQFNQLSGEFPASIANATNLVVLSLEDNLIEGTIPSSLTQSTSLQLLFVGSNLMDGRISHFSAISPVQSVSFRNNAFTGTVPESLTASIGLGFLALSNNLLDGTVPAFNADFGSLSSLEIVRNNFIGDLDGLLNSLPRSVQFFIAGGNRLKGTIPTTIGEFKLLNRLEVSENRLTGPIPSEIGATALVSLQLHSNLLSGRLPTELGELRGLSELVVRGNRLTGPLPSELGNIGSGLLGLFVDHNFLSGILPEELVNLVDIDTVEISFNRFIGDSNVLERMPSLVKLLVAESGLDHNICNSTLDLVVFADSLCNASIPLCPCCTGCCDRNTCDNLLSG